MGVRGRWLKLWVPVLQSMALQQGSFRCAIGSEMATPTADRGAKGKGVPHADVGIVCIISPGHSVMPQIQSLPEFNFGEDVDDYPSSSPAAHIVIGATTPLLTCV
jgi:hypothetical protein